MTTTLDLFNNLIDSGIPTAVVIQDALEDSTISYPMLKRSSVKPNACALKSKTITNG